MNSIGIWLIVFVNVLLIALLTGRTLAIDNDKMHVVFIFYYAVIVVLNLILWLILARSKNKLRDAMGRIVGAIAILFVLLMGYIASI